MATVCARARQKVISGSSPRLAGRTWCSMFERRRTCSTSACVLDPVRRSPVRVPKPCCSVRLRPASTVTVLASTPVSGCDQVDRDGGRTRTLVTGSSRPRIHRPPRGDQAVRRRPPCVPGCAARWKGKSQRSYEAIENEERLEPEHTARNPPLVTHTSVKVVLLLANQCVSDHTCFTSQHLEKGPTSFLSSGGVRG